MKICLYGAGNDKIKEIYKIESYKLGCEIAKRSHSLVFGGGDAGVMGYVSKGVLENNGKILGIAPKWIDDFEALKKDCSEFIYTETMDERKNLFLKYSDCFIIAPGGIGTLDEFFEIIVLKKLKVHNKKIVLFNINNYYDKMIEMLNFMIKEKTIRERKNDLFKIANSIEEVFEILES